jgi:hypothetical protein
MDLIKDYIESGKALQQKYDEIRRGIVTRQKVLAEELKPIVEPLQTISEKLDSRKEIPQDVLKRIGSVAEKYLRQRSDKMVKPDLKFGIYNDDEGNFYVGEIPLIIIENDLQFQNGMEFKGTEGLWQLLTLENPVRYTREDLNNYEKIVLSTNTYRRNNDPNATSIKSSRGYKYSQFIKPILQKNNILKRTTAKKILSYHPSLAEEMSARVDESSEKLGSGLGKILTNTPVEYVYWNNFDELLDRLYILYGEIKSGNNNPILVNELINILQEIREI